MRKLIGVLAALVATAAMLSVGSPASAAPGPDYTQVPDLSGYAAVDPASYFSLDYKDNGRTFFVTPGGRVCALGSGYAYVGCNGRPGGAPRDAVGVAISGGQEGPYWVPRDTAYSTVPQGWFQPPLLDVGQSITVAGSTCAVSPVTVTCVGGPRAFTLAQSWFKFVYPAGDKYHDNNIDPKYLPADQR
ncbi:hypothetical protein BH683_018510 [Williamsia sp. 1138]|uniref:hypothetical protein n=1 Tax=Williamsia sp. 1138 TaxID=1903117 RepID=UPI000A1078EF|nr:hypothetical protein [Williamsia sp. 1138]OZG27403.1 hypothetical protein BH683_018510 [Williamsia sp. 1138]